jgi:hypothetical protein
MCSVFIFQCALRQKGGKEGNKVRVQKMSFLFSTFLRVIPLREIKKIPAQSFVYFCRSQNCFGRTFKSRQNAKSTITRYKHVFRQGILTRECSAYD